MERAESASSDPCEAVLRTIAELRDLPIRPEYREKLEAITHSLELNARAYMTPKVRVDWRAYGLTPGEEKLANVLLARSPEMLTRERIMNAMYWDRHGADEPQEKIINVWKCKIERKLKGTDCPYEIQADWGRGYKMVPTQRAEAA